MIPNTRRDTLHAQVQENVAHGSAVYTDALKSYSGLSGDYAHETVDHAERYLDGRVHTNGAENFWSLLKRGLTARTSASNRSISSATSMKGVSRSTGRDLDDLGRFQTVLMDSVGRRVRYSELTGKS